MSSRIDKRASLARKAPVPSRRQDLAYRGGPVCKRTGAATCNCDLLRQDDPSKEDARDSAGQRFQEQNQGEAFWQKKEGMPEKLARHAGYRSERLLPTYGIANRKYLYLIDTIPFYMKRWRKPPGESKPYY